MTLEPPTTQLVALGHDELLEVTGGSMLGDRASAAYNYISSGVQSAYSAAKTNLRDNYRGAVNWGTAAVVGAMTAHKVYGSENSLGATVDTIGALKGAFDKTGKLPAWAPFGSYY